MELDDIDNKHAAIVRDAYEHLEDSEAYRDANFRNWSGQSDVSVPMQISSFNIKIFGFFHTILKFLYRKAFQRDAERFLLNSFKDDISIIKSIGGEHVLKENPAHINPGANVAYFIEGTSVNLRMLRYVYMCQQIKNYKLLENNGVWVDVGSYYGGYQGIVHKYFPKTTSVMVDFHHQLCRSYIFLSKLYPDALHILPDQISNYDSLEKMPKGSFVYVQQ